jgi:hypothetical protein
MLQNYLENKQYLYLMNSSRLLFGDIKFETVRFNYVVDECQPKMKYRSEPDRWDKEISLLYEIFIAFTKRVKSPSQQIQLTIRNALQDNLLKYSNYFTNINGLEIQYPQNITDAFDFNLFNNIPRVKLNNWDRLARIKQGLQNIQELDICQCTDLISIECPLIDLDKLRIRYCNQLVFVSPIKRTTKKINIESSYELPLVFPKNSNMAKLKITSPVDSLFFNEIPYRSLQVLHLSGIRAKETDDFSIFARIPELYLQNVSDGYFPSFPKFQGRVLYIGGFDLLSWHDKSSSEGYGFENLRELTSIFCSNFSYFPVFPNLRRLFIYEDPNLQEILPQSFPNCITLRAGNCSSLVKIHRFPKIQSIEVSDCENFKEFIGKMNIQRVELSGLLSFQNISSLRNVHDVMFDNCTIRSFDGFDRSELPNSSRIVRLCNFDANDSYMKGLGNVGSLTLYHVNNLNDGKGIHDIDDLILEGVSLKNFKRLQVRRSLILHSPNFIYSFHGLKTLLRIAISIEHRSFGSSLKLSDLSYFNCDQFYCHRSQPWVAEAQQYLKDPASSSFAPIFQTMKEFYIITDLDRYDSKLRDGPAIKFSWDTHMSKTRLW